MTQSFNLMAKPSSFHCNMDCDYCFYLEKEGVFPRGKVANKPTFMMPDDVLRSYIKSYIASQSSPEIEFIWQGGEPTMANIEFFQKVVKYQNQFAKGKTINNSLQTNGLLINDEWARFLKSNRFLVGLSIDGPPELHNHYRVTKSGQPTFKKVMRAVELFHKHEVDFNTLTVVNSQNVQYPTEVYRFLKDIGSTYHQYIPVVESVQHQGVGDIHIIDVSQSMSLLPFSVDASAYGDFMNVIFDEWVKNDVSTIFIQMFESALASWSGYQPSLCIFRKTCGDAMVIEQNGDIYSCDHYVYNNYKLGNILTGKISKMYTSKKQQKFGHAKAKVGDACTTCPYQFACNGGCPKHRLSLDAQGHPHNVLCEGYKKIFSHIEPYMRFMAKELAHGRAPSNVMGVSL